MLKSLTALRYFDLSGIISLKCAEFLLYFLKKFGQAVAEYVVCWKYSKCGETLLLS